MNVYHILDSENADYYDFLMSMEDFIDLVTKARIEDVKISIEMIDFQDSIKIVARHYFDYDGRRYLYDVTLKEFDKDELFRNHIENLEENFGSFFKTNNGKE